MSETVLHITAGGGPKECQWVVVKTALAFCTEAKQGGLTASILWEDEPESIASSVLIRFTGKGAGDFARARIGTVRWIGQSPFRPHHKRKNWFIGVSRAPGVQDYPALREADITYQTLKASGPGGQHVNKTESAVRAVHGPTGLAVVAHEERSQFANKRLTRIKLAALLSQREQQDQNQRQKHLWSKHKSLERGNAVRTFEGAKFKRR